MPVPMPMPGYGAEQGRPSPICDGRKKSGLCCGRMCGLRAYMHTQVCCLWAMASPRKAVFEPLLDMSTSARIKEDKSVRASGPGGPGLS